MDEAATQLGKTAEFFEEKFNGDKDRKLFCRFEEYTNSEKRGYHLKLWKTGNLQKEETTTPAKEIPEPVVRLVYRSSLYIFCTKKTAFTEYIMPYLLAGLAFVLFFTEFILTYLLSGLGLIFFLIDLRFSSP